MRSFRKIAVIAGLLLCTISASAKDVITKTDGSKVDAKVEEVTETLIKYRRASNPAGSPLYTISLSSVASIAYEDGTVDVFNSETTLTSTPSTAESAPVATSSAPTDEELLRYAESIPAYKQSGTISDTELFRMSSIPINSTPKALYAKAKKYRIIGWTVGSALILAGVIVPNAIHFWNDDAYEPAYYVPMIGGIIGGTAVCIGFNLYANSLKKQARELEMYSANIIENDILNFGGNKLTAGVNMMGNRMTHTHGLGLSLKFNF